MSTPARFQEQPFRPMSGWLPMCALLAYELAFVGVTAVRQTPDGWFIASLVLAVLAPPFTLPGLFLVNPNTSRVLVLFGRYRGTVRTDGFYWTNPFTVKHRVSLRANNVASEKIKVNDLCGNPIEIGAVVVWQVQDTAQAMFAVEDYSHYVDIQIETAVRHLAGSHPYDEGQNDADPEGVTLRGDSERIGDELQVELGKRLERAGIEVLEARISHLAYAQEIASAMLQRQQATAVIAARQKIVEGAVGMVEQALDHLNRSRIVELDPERRATLVGNLLVVLCSHANPQPVINTGGLYN